MQALIEGVLAKLQHQQDYAELPLDLLIRLQEAGILSSELHDYMFRRVCT